MNFLEATGLVAAGTAVAMGGALLLQLTEQSPIADTAISLPIAQTPVEPVFDANPEVTRAATPTLPIAAADRLHDIISQSDEGLSSREPLTAEQQQVVSFFEKIARDRNAEGGTETNLINFDNLTIDRLDVKYYYTAAERYADINVPVLLSEQAELVQANICDQESIRTLITEYGLGYSYTFISKDFRYIGEVVGDVTRCAG